MKQTWLLKLIPSSTSHPNQSSSLPSIATHLLSKSTHTIPEQPPQTDPSIVTSICDSLRKGLNFDSLTRRFNSLELTDSLTQTVLFELKQPIDAKRALGFFHWSAQRRSSKHGTLSYCIAIHILVRAKLSIDARALLESVITKTKSDGFSRFFVVDSLIGSYRDVDSNPFVFDLLVQIYSKLRMIDVAVDVCEYLGEKGFNLSVISYNKLIHVVEKSDQTPLVWRIYEHMIKTRTYPNGVTIRVMIDAMCKEGKLQKIIDILDRIHGKRCAPSTIVNTCLVFGMIEEGKIEDGLVLLKRLLMKNMIFDTISYSLIVYARVKLGSLDFAWEVYEEMLKRGFNANSFVYTSFIGAHCKEGRIEVAKSMMEEMENLGLKPYDETFNHLIMGCSRMGMIEECLKFCKRMLATGLVPSCAAFNDMLEKLCEIGDVKYLKQADEMLTVLLNKGFVADKITYSHLIAGHAKEGNTEEALKLYYEAEYRSLSPGSLAFEALVSSLCRCGKFDEAEKFLMVMKRRSLAPSAHVYDTLIVSLVEKGNITRAHHLYNEIVDKGLKPSDQCFRQLMQRSSQASLS